MKQSHGVMGAKRANEARFSCFPVRAWVLAPLGATGEFYEIEHIVEERQRRKGRGHGRWKRNGSSNGASVCR